MPHNTEVYSSLKGSTARRRGATTVAGAAIRFYYDGELLSDDREGATAAASGIAAEHFASATGEDYLQMYIWYQDAIADRLELLMRAAGGG